MRDGRPVVVPFERPAAYWAARARRLKAPHQLPDAARLMRKAYEKSGDPALALELYRIYANMECHTAAERCLASALGRSGLTGEICFGIGCCALERGDEALAERALEESLRLSPQGLHADHAQELLETHPWQQEECLPRGARGEALYHRARKALLAGDQKKALCLAKKGWKKSHSQALALLLGALLPPGKAALVIHWACRQQPNQQTCWIMLALACYHSGQEVAARQYMLIAFFMSHTGYQAEAFCVAAWEMGFFEEALTLIQMRLSLAPLSADMMRLKYLALRHLGRDQEAERALSSLMDMDPDDTAAHWYRRHPEEKRLYPGRMMVYQLLAGRVYAQPQRLRPGPLNRALHLTVMTLSGILSAPVIYRLLPILWRRLSKAEKAACDRRHPHYPLLFCLYLLMRTGHMDKAREMIAHAPGKRRIIRALRRYMQPKKE